VTEQEHLELVTARASELAAALRDASDAGVSHALILPQLMIVFRETFGEPPSGWSLPGMPS
jgi:hypothetical protein